MSRTAAGLLYAALTITVLSKCYSTKAFVHHSWFGAVVDIEPSHDVHTYFGYMMLIAGVGHGILHIIRFSIGGDADLLYKTDAGRSGVICMLFLFPVVLPMRFKWFKDKMDFETRKATHMLFLPMLVGLCFHSYVFRYVGAILIVWYTVDRIYFTTKQTFLIQHPTFEAVGRGTMVGLDLPQGYEFKAGSYIYVNCPAISCGEWHPFSIIPVLSGHTAAFYAEVVGDWTRALFRMGLEQHRLPLWISAAQPSTMEKTIYYNKVVLICTGAGITPGISIAQRFCEKKSIHLLWITRDAALVALFEKQLHLVKSTVYLTGKPAPEVKRALSKLLNPAEDSVHGGILGNNGMMRTSRTVDDSIHRLELCSKSLHRPRSVLEISRSSLLHLTPSQSHHRPSSVSATLKDVEEKDDQPSNGHGDVEKTGAAVNCHLPPAVPAPSHNGRVNSNPADTPAEDEDGDRGRWKSFDHTKFPKVSVSDATSKKGKIPTAIANSHEEGVKLVIGRPDIKAHLLEIFNRGNDADLNIDRLEAGSLDDNHRGPPRPRQNSDRLNKRQQQSKAVLLAADKTMVESIKENGGGSGPISTRANSAAINVSAPPTGADDDTPSGMGINPPLVLYCGANPSVEAVIDSTCTANNVPWKKEYFGAW